MLVPQVHVYCPHFKQTILIQISSSCILYDWAGGLACLPLGRVLFRALPLRQTRGQQVTSAMEEWLGVP